MNKGKLYLIPTVIAEDSHKETLTSPIKKAIQEIDIFIVENIKSARRNIKKIFNEKNIDRITFLLNGKHDKINLEKDFLGNILLNKNIGLLQMLDCHALQIQAQKLYHMLMNFKSMLFH